MRSPVCIALLSAACAAGEVLVLDNATFDSVVRSDGKPTFVKFYRNGCNACKKLAPVWEQLATDLAGRVVLAEVNVDTESGAQLAGRETLALRQIPVLLLFPPDSEHIYRFVGKRIPETLSAFALGGWAETEVYDPATQPPPKKNFLESLLEKLEAWGIKAWHVPLGLAIGLVIGITIATRIIRAPCPAPSQYEAQPAKAKRKLKKTD